METDLQNLRKAAVNVIASQKRLQHLYEQTQADVDKWEQRVQIALQKGDDFLVQEALKRKKMHSEVLNSLKSQLDRAPFSVQNLKQNITALETKISEAKTLKTQVAAANVNGKLQSAASIPNTNNKMSAFDRLEQKVLQMETCSHQKELSEVKLESQIAMSNSSSDVDWELEEMKVQLSMFPDLFQHNLCVGTEVDEELEALKRSIAEL